MSAIKFVRPKNGGSLVDVCVTPGSGRTLFLGVRDDGRLRVALKSPPEGGKANKELLEFFKGFFGECKLVGGAKSRKKMVYVKDVGPDKVATTILGHI